MGLKVLKIPFDKWVVKAGRGGASLDAGKAADLLTRGVLDRAVRAAEENYAAWKALADREHKRCKASLAEAARTVKYMESADWIPNPLTLSEVQVVEKDLERTVKILKADNKAYSVAFADGGFRGDLKGPISKAFTQLDAVTIGKLVNGPMASRGAIIANNRAIVATLARIDEYHKRAVVLCKRAESVQRAARGGRGKYTIHRVFAGLDTQIDRTDGFLQKVLNKIKSRDSTMKLPVGKREMMLRGIDAELDENLKKCRGALKTLGQQIDGVARRLAAADEVSQQMLDLLGQKEAIAKQKKETLTMATKALAQRRARPQGRPLPIPTNR